MKRKISIFLGFVLCLLLCACGTKEQAKGEMHIYYLNADKNALREETYPMMSVEETLKKLEFHEVLTSKIRVDSFSRNQTNLELHFTTEYYSLDKSTEVLTRAAIVRTLTQIEGIQFVTFYVEDNELTDKSGRPIGAMRAEDFVQSTGSSIDSYQTTDLTLYFADKDGKHLKKKTVNNVHYNVNTAMERVVVEQLMKGTTASGYQSTIPKTTMILGVSVKEDVCYVNLDSKFISDRYDLDPSVAIYSIVNSVIANSTVTQVQILIDGSSDVVYQGDIDLSRPLKANNNLIKEK